MDIHEFIDHYSLAADSIDGEACLGALLSDMEQGLAGTGNIPMIPSYLSLDVTPQIGVPCCVLDAGGTNLRAARAEFDSRGNCVLRDIVKAPMPGSRGEMSFDAFYGELARYVHSTSCPERIGFCFSYNVSLERSLDGILDAWCKEVNVPEAPGKYVGASLKKAIGPDCAQVTVLNDSTAALLGAHGADPEVSVALILGTGINVCYVERCRNAPKLPKDLKKDTVILSTEIGEFRGIPKNPFEEAVIAMSAEPELAHAEKQCAGAYLGEILSRAFREAKQLGLLAPDFPESMTLPQISHQLAELPAAPKQIALATIGRAAKIAAILTAGAILRSCPEGECCTMVIEGSQYEKLTGFAEAFQKELAELLDPRHITCHIQKVENSCLIGAAIAAFAEGM